MIKSNSTSNRKEGKYIARYVGSGVINSLIGFIVIFSIMALGFSPIVSNIIGYAVGFILGFILSKKFVFRSNGRIAAESVRYLIAFFISFFLNLLILQWSLIYLNFHEVASQLTAAATYTVVMYTLIRLFVFDITRENE